MHVSSALNTIKKWSTFKAYKEGYDTYVEQKEATKEAKANLQLFATPASEGKKADKKGTEKTSVEASGKNRSEKEKASQKTKEGMTQVDATAPDLCAECKALYEKATATKEAAKIQKDAAATKMFQFYANLLSSDVKYTWNKIVWEQTGADPYKDLQGVSRKAQGDLRVSHSTTASCSTFSLCFPTMQLSKRSITFPTCSRSPSRLAYVSSYRA
jgi:hypothetical protein